MRPVIVTADGLQQICCKNHIVAGLGKVGTPKVRLHMWKGTGVDQPNAIRNAFGHRGTQDEQVKIEVVSCRFVIPTRVVASVSAYVNNTTDDPST